jgi:hypothetical protein
MENKSNARKDNKSEKDVRGPRKREGTGDVNKARNLKEVRMTGKQKSLEGLASKKATAFFISKRKPHAMSAMPWYKITSRNLRAMFCFALRPKGNTGSIQGLRSFKHI